ncbi:MAG: recombinase family protein, partial [Promicromonosporaceae bacterium]|nr:recombinase family protein [Promicromonosporaceae bacterium]
MLAAIYSRQSKTDADGIDRQLERCRALITARGWTPAATYQDDDVSASKPRGPHTGWGRMLADAHNFDAVVAVDLDRLLRSTTDLNTLIEHGLKAVTVDGEIDLSTADGEFRATMLAGIARFEVRRKSERQKRAHRQRAERGAMPKGNRLTGYTTDGQIIESEAVTVRRIFAQAASGMAHNGIARRLNDDGVPTMKGAKWHGRTVRNMLLNPRYKGESTYRGETVGTGTWEPLVDPVVFDAIGARLAMNEWHLPVAGRASLTSLGSGIYLCDCGKPMRGVSGQSYGCCYTRTTVTLDAYVVAAVREWLGSPELAAWLVASDSRLPGLAC